MTTPTAAPGGAMEFSAELLRQVLDALHEGVVLLDASGRVAYWNAWMSELSGIDRGTAQGCRLLELFPELEPSRVLEAVDWALKRRLPSVLSPSLNKAPFPLRRDERPVEQSIRVTPLWMAGDEIHCLIQISDVTAMLDKERLLRMRAQQLREMAGADSLTGVANRRRFQEHMEEEMRRHRRSGEPFSLIMLDIDYFKNFNDRYGHLAGDEALILVARSIDGILHRAGDLMARIGGEEFAVLLPNTDAAGAGRIARHVREVVARLAIPHAASSVASVLTISQGVVTAHVSPKLSTRQILAAADDALYSAKRGGRDGWRAVTLGAPLPPLAED